MSNGTDANFEVHLLPCDISAYRKGNTGIDYVTTFDSGLPGPHVMVNALTHGNELCGAHALTYLFENDVRPVRGRLTLSFANVAAYETFDAAHPYASRFVDEDFNRLWDQSTLDGPRTSRELIRARAMREVFADADHLLDIHSVDLPQPAMLLAGRRAKGRALAAAIGKPRHVVMDRGHDAGKRVRDFAAFDAMLRARRAPVLWSAVITSIPRQRRSPSRHLCVFSDILALSRRALPTPACLRQRTNRSSLSR